MPKLNVLMINEGDQWVAQGLQHDITAQGNDVEDAMIAFQKTFVSEMAVCEDLGYNFPKSIPAAPSYYWELFYESGVAIDSDTANTYRSPSSNFELRELRRA